MAKEEAVTTEQEAREGNNWTNGDGEDPFFKGVGESSLVEDFGEVTKALGTLTSGAGVAGTQEAVSTIEGFVTGLPLAGLATDPLHTLLTFGLGFLVDLIKPLDDALKLVTGDAGELEKAAEAFKKISEELKSLASDFATKVDTGTQSWQGASATASRERLTEFGVGIQETGFEAESIVALLEGSKALMEAAYDVVMGLIASLIEWLVITWLAAQAAAVPTLGASEVAAAGATAVEVGVTTTRVAGIVQKVTAVLQKISRVFKILAGKLAGPRWWRTTAGKFAGKDAMAAWNKAPGWGPAGRQFAKDAVTAAGTSIVDSAKGGGGKAVYDMTTDEPPDAAEIDRKLSI
ncbi:MAG: WXG100 family type VII secretion target [Umezawaea sp.]